jgi:hypothetical protein
MQSGAFVHLILTLAAIASKMHMLIPEIKEALSIGLAALHRVSRVLEVRQPTLSFTNAF